MPQSPNPYEDLDSSLFFAVKKLNRALDVIAERVFKKIDLKPSCASILMILSQENGKIQKDLAKKLCITAPSLTRIIEKLIYMGLVEVIREGRTKKVFLTDKGHELIPDLHKAHIELHETLNLLVETEYSDTLVAELIQITNQLK